jgi:hypothetical protein
MHIITDTVFLAVHFDTRVAQGLSLATSFPGAKTVPLWGSQDAKGKGWFCRVGTVFGVQLYSRSSTNSNNADWIRVQVVF